MDFGRLSERVTILHRTADTNEDVYGTSTTEWTTFATVWAEVQDVLPSRAERVADAIDIGRRPSRIRMRYRTDVTSAMRFRLSDNRELRIVAGPAVLGHKDGIEFMAEQVTSEGEEP